MFEPLQWCSSEDVGHMYAVPTCTAPKIDFEWLTLTHQRPCHLLLTVMPVRVELICRRQNRLAG